ncbi:MAG: PorT family protein, partial [Bacteroidales bacterium]
MKKITYAILMLMACISTAKANEPEGETHILRWSYLQGLEYRLKAGFNVGGISPMPLPAEIREIDSYDPTLQIAIEADIVKWFEKWGLLV